MARRKRGRRSRRRGMGSIITVKRLSGAERISNPSSMTGAILPAVLGGGAALLSAIGIRQFVEPTPDNEPVVNNADLIGLGIGGLVGLALWNMASKPAGLAALVGAGLVTATAKLPSMMSSDAMSPPGTGAVVAQTVRGPNMMRGTRGTGAIVMQPAAPGSYGPGGGDSVSLQGLRAGINPSVFGRPSWRR